MNRTGEGDEGGPHSDARAGKNRHRRDSVSEPANQGGRKMEQEEMDACLNAAVEWVWC